MNCLPIKTLSLGTRKRWSEVWYIVQKTVNGGNKKIWILKIQEKKNSVVESLTKKFDLTILPRLNIKDQKKTKLADFLEKLDTLHITFRRRGQIYGCYKPCTHPHLLHSSTSSQNKVTLTCIHSNLKKSVHPHNPHKTNKKDHSHLHSHSPSHTYSHPTHTQSKKGHNYSHLSKEGHTHSNTLTTTQKCHTLLQSSMLTKER